MPDASKPPFDGSGHTTAGASKGNRDFTAETPFKQDTIDKDDLGDSVPTGGETPFSATDPTRSEEIPAVANEAPTPYRAMKSPEQSPLPSGGEKTPFKNLRG